MPTEVDSSFTSRILRCPTKLNQEQNNIKSSVSSSGEYCSLHKLSVVQETEHQTRSGTTMTMTFRLAGHGVVYADHSPHYDEIAGIVRVKQPVRAWLSPRAESIIQPADYVPMYKFERDGRVILTYPEKVEDAQFLIHLVPTMGLLFTLIGIWTFSQRRWQEKISAMRSSNDA